MATMYITEYKDAVGSLQIPQEPPLAIQKITFATTTASAALQSDTRYVSIQLSADGYIQFAGTPVATTSTSRLHEANTVSFHGVRGDRQTLKIAAVTA